ncbi:MAG TPA: hypothetical protein VHA80_07075 [Solirubrobacterales bacterium]|nr:hypothetical protein [Solirubrobacterales bacterium]
MNADAAVAPHFEHGPARASASRGWSVPAASAARNRRTRSSSRPTAAGSSS